MFWPILISAVSFWGLALGGGFYWARRYVRAIERQGAAREQIALLEARVVALERERSTAQISPGAGAAARLRDPASDTGTT